MFEQQSASTEQTVLGPPQTGADRNAATVARVLFSTRWLWLVEVVPMGWPL